MDVRTATLLCIFCAPGPAIAAQQDSATAQAREEPDEIIVTGQRQRFELRLQMEDAERVVYNLFNEFNDEARFEISCETHAVTGTMRKSQVCQTAFEREALALEGQDYLAAYRTMMEYAAVGADPADQNFSPYSTAAPSAMRIAPQQRQLQRKMREVAQEHPEFVEALVRFVETKGRYEQSRGLDSEVEETP
jgi:hypothetical protein